MKYQRFAALVLAAALLTGCGGTQSSPSAAADQSSDSSRSTPGAVAQAVQTDRITDQYTLEKNVSGVWGRKRCSAFPSMCPSWNATARMPPTSTMS